MSILVIGHSGQVARSLVERAGEADSVTALGRPELDITDADALARTIDRAEPDLVINASAYTAVDAAETDEAAAFAVNEAGPAALARLCKAAGIPLFHYSTDYVFDGSKDGAYSETDPTAPLGVYGRSKHAGEVAIADAMDDYLILRTAWVYSPFGKNFLKTMLRLAGDRDELTIVSDQYGCPTSVLDIADASLSLARQWRDGQKKPGIYHLCATGSISWRGFASAIFETSAGMGGPTAKAHPIPSKDYPTPAKRPANSRLDCSRLKHDYGIELPQWTDSMQSCVRRVLKEDEDA